MKFVLAVHGTGISRQVISSPVMANSNLEQKSPIYAKFLIFSKSKTIEHPEAQFKLLFDFFSNI